MPHDANQALPGLALLLAERPREIGEDEEMVDASLLPEAASLHAPPARPARKQEIERGAVVAQRPREAELRCAPAEELLGGPRQQALAGAVDEAKRLGLVEREDGDVHLGHHGRESSARV